MLINKNLSSKREIKKKQLLFFIAVVIFLNIVSLSINKAYLNLKELNLVQALDQKNNAVKLLTYQEDFTPNASKGFIKKTKNTILFSYQKSISKTRSFVAVYFEMDSLKVNFYDYDYLEVEISAKHAKRIPVSIVLNYNDTLNQYLTEYINVNPNTKTYLLKLSNFTTPAEWYEHHGFSKQFVPRTLKSNIHKIAFESCHLLPKGIKDEYNIKKVSLIKDGGLVKKIVLIADLLLLIFFCIYYFGNFSNKNKIIHIPIAPVPTNDSDSDEVKITNFLALNYHNPDLTLLILQKSLGIGQKKISEEIKNTFNLSFPQYLAKIRIEESKRLLKEKTFESVAEVGYAVGFNSSTNFNRVFKSLENISPKQYQEKENQEKQVQKK